MSLSEARHCTDGAFNSIELLTTLCDSTIQILCHDVSCENVLNSPLLLLVHFSPPT